MKSLATMVLVLLCMSGALYAQRLGGSGGDTIMVSTSKGLFALRDGVLAKYDAATLEQKQLFELFGPMPAPPENNTDRAAMLQYYAERQRRQAPAIMLAKDNSLLVVIGDGFARINQDNLKVETSVDLSMPGAAEAEGGRGFRASEATPGYLLVGNNLLLMNSKEIIAISVSDGKILARKPLAKELQPQSISYPMGGRGGDGGRSGNNQGNR